MIGVFFPTNNDGQLCSSKEIQTVGKIKLGSIFLEYKRIVKMFAGFVTRILPILHDFEKSKSIFLILTKSINIPASSYIF